jgi:hypothetical protein
MMKVDQCPLASLKGYGLTFEVVARLEGTLLLHSP